MKFRILAACAIVLACGALLFGCAQTPKTQSPSQVTAAALDAVKARDATTFAKYYAGDANADGQNLAGNVLGQAGVNTELTADQQAVVDKLADKFLDFDYKVGKESINGDTATVDVTFTTYDFAAFAKNVLAKYLGNAFATAFTPGGASQEAMADVLAAAVSDNMSLLNSKSVSTTVPVTLTKTQDGWKIKQLDQAVLDALMGGVLSTFGNLASVFGGQS